MGGGILPVTVHEGKVMFLFGKERAGDSTPGWSDFAGGQDEGESHIETAAREGAEELTGFLGDKPAIRKLLDKSPAFVEIASGKTKTYRTHLVPLVYDPALPLYFNNNAAFVHKHLDPDVIKRSKIFEKTMIQWFAYDDLHAHMPHFRPFYREVVEQLLDRRTELETLCRRTQAAVGRRRRRTRRRL